MVRVMEFVIVGWMLPPKNISLYEPLEPVKMIVLRKGLCRCNLVKDLQRWPSWIIKWVLNPMTKIRGKEEKAQARRPWEYRGREGSCTVTSQGTSKVTRGKEGFSSRAFRRNRPYWHLDFWLLALELWEMNFCFISCQVCSNSLWQLQEPTYQELALLYIRLILLSPLLRLQFSSRICSPGVKGLGPGWKSCQSAYFGQFPKNIQYTDLLFLPVTLLKAPSIVGLTYALTSSEDGVPHFSGHTVGF